MDKRKDQIAAVSGFVEAFNKGDMTAAVSFFAEDAKNFGRTVGREGLRRVLLDIQKTFPDIRLDISDTIVDGDWVVERGTFTGTHGGVGELPVNGGMLVGVAPTNKRFSVSHIHMFLFAGGKIVDHFANRDDIGMMQQLGLLPAPAGRPDLQPAQQK